MAVDKSVSFEVHGAKELARALKRVEGDFDKELRRELKGIATKVADDARRGVPRVSGRAAGSLRPRASAQGAGITGGGPRAPYYPWLDFGGSVGRGHRPGVSWSGAIRLRPHPPAGGNYVYPAIARNSDWIGEQVDDAIVRVGRKAGFDMDKGGIL